jgi:uncharacterized protein (UPF0335 family)
MYAPYFEHHEYCTEACRREVQSTIKGECIDCGVQFTKHRTSKVRDRCRECHRGIAQRKRIAVLTERGVYGAARASAPLLTIACEQCGADMLTYDKVRRWCSAECKYDARSDAGRGPRPIERGERRCIDCSADISHVWSLRRCRDCDVKRMRASMRAKGGDDKKRARRHGVQYEYVSRRRLYKRDGWQCGICSELIDHTLAYPDPRSASLDHAIPISLGGPHTYANCQAAHLDCNIAKSNRVDDELEKAI